MPHANRNLATPCLHSHQAAAQQYSTTAHAGRTPVIPSCTSFLAGWQLVVLLFRPVTVLQVSCLSPLRLLTLAAAPRRLGSTTWHTRWRQPGHALALEAPCGPAPVRWRLESGLSSAGPAPPAWRPLTQRRQSNAAQQQQTSAALAGTSKTAT